MANTNLMGSIDLLKMRKSCIIEIKGVKCVLIPIEENDINVSMDLDTKKPKAAYYSLNIIERREKSKYGHTHYAKPYYRMHFLDKYSEDDKKAMRNVYMGDFKPLEFGTPVEGQTALPQADTPKVRDREYDLPF